MLLHDVSADGRDPADRAGGVWCGAGTTPSGGGGDMMLMCQTRHEIVT